MCEKLSEADEDTARCLRRSYSYTVNDNVKRLRAASTPSTKHYEEALGLGWRKWWSNAMSF